MKCFNCHYFDTKVIDSRLTNQDFAVRRRRECLKCGFRFSTLEEAVIFDLTIVKQNHGREVYNKEKVEKGLKKALEKRQTSDEKFKKLVNQIEIDLQKLKKKEIESKEIGEIIMKRLKGVDKVAYIRFASVYKSFEDPETFRKEINELLKKKVKKNKKSKK
ncbi:MAG: transcriptional regulator NrdR [Patescibacteria group bacterium]|nr:transcriptional regulator NrdR [Patescibacteria group bacterium]